MPTSSAAANVARLWQLPLLLLSILLFGYAAYLFVDPAPGLTIEQKIDVARKLLAQERHDAAEAQLNRLLNSEKLSPIERGRIHLLLAESIDMGQRRLRIAVPINYANIIEQTRLALAAGVEADAIVYRRLAQSYEALERFDEALDHYRKAMAMDPEKSIAVHRKIIDLQLQTDQLTAAEHSLGLYLDNPTLSAAERAWALSEKAQLLIDSERFVDARIALDEALKTADDPILQGTVNFRLGYAAYKLKNADDAERYFRVARDLLRVQHPLDGDAAFWLGRIAQDRGDARQAISFYEVVLQSHPGNKIAPLARMGRGVSRIQLAQDDPGLSDLQELVGQIQARPSRAKYRDQALASLRQACEILAGRGNLEGAIELLAHEQILDPDPSAPFFSRAGSVYEKRAEQIERSIPGSAPADRIRKEQQWRSALIRAGDAFLAHSNKLTVVDDKGYVQSLWRSIDLYERASAVANVVSSLELFVAERPDDPLAPDALLRLGRAYQSAGMFDKAITAFQRNQFRYPQSLAASKSAVPLAQAYLAKGPEYFGRAESVLLSVLDNNPLLGPDSEEYRQAVFELAQLFYRSQRFEESVVRLEEFIQRYPRDERVAQLTFLMADSYRKSAGLLESPKRSASASLDESGPPAIDLVSAANARKERLMQAKTLYDRVIETFRNKQPTREIDQLYLRLAHFYRADCLYDLGEYAEAVKLYESAAFRYQDDPSSLAAYVQIVNAYTRLGRLDDARTANERAKYLLRRMPPEAFANGTFNMPRQYWEEWLKWTTDAGMW
jgi:tetratricopeptide (TPR) repeat protein